MDQPHAATPPAQSQPDEPIPEEFADSEALAPIDSRPEGEDGHWDRDDD